MSLKTFIKNLRYLFKYNIKNIQYITDKSLCYEDVDAILNHYRYELKDELANLPVPKIKTAEETIEDLINNKKSIARYGDGEFMAALGYDMAYQKVPPDMAKRLRDILVSNDENIYIGIASLYFKSLKGIYPDAVKFIRSWWGARNQEEFLKLFDFNKQYYNTEFSQLYSTYMEYDFEKHFNSMKKIWDKRDVTIIQGKGIRDNHEYDIFENVNSVSYQFGPTRDAYFEYDSLLENALTIPKDNLVICILGPTATILAYDLAKHGYQALDLGHVAKDYEWYMQKKAKDGVDYYKLD